MTTIQAGELTENDSTLRYVAGYVCRHLCKKIDRKPRLEVRNDPVFIGMAKDKTVKDQGTGEEWTDLIDREGL